MKFKKPILLIFIFVTLLIIGACSTAPYAEDSIIRGTIEELITKEKFLFDDKYLLVKEANEDELNNTTYEIPVDSFKDYEVGDNVEVVVYSNLEADLWNLDHMKFEINIVE